MHVPPTMSVCFFLIAIFSAIYPSLALLNADQQAEALRLLNSVRSNVTNPTAAKMLELVSRHGHSHALNLNCARKTSVARAVQGTRPLCSPKLDSGH